MSHTAVAAEEQPQQPEEAARLMLADVEQNLSLCLEMKQQLSQHAQQHAPLSLAASQHAAELHEAVCIKERHLQDFRHRLMSIMHPLMSLVQKH